MAFSTIVSVSAAKPISSCGRLDGLASSARMSGLATNLSCGRAVGLLELRRRRSTRQSATAATRIATSAGKAAITASAICCGGLDVDRDRRRRGWQRDRAGDQGHARPIGGGGGDREALRARRAVGDDSHGIDRLMGRPGGDEDVLAGERHLRAEEPVRAAIRSIAVRLGQAARPKLAACHLAFVGLDDVSPHRP